MTSTLMRHILLPFLCGLAFTVSAAPMGFKGSWMTMGEYTPNYRELTLNKALTSRDALGVTSIVMRSEDKHHTFDNYELTYTRLLKRWNMPDAQANIWFIGGIGESTMSGLTGAKLTASPGVQVDYETTRVYLSANARTYQGQAIHDSIVSARAGFSFYEVNYDEIQPWFILEARRMSFVSDKNEITPMLRLIHNRYFLEAGMNDSGQARFNFMYIF